MVLKPTGRAPHEGGKLFDVGTPSYNLLLEWVQAGCPGPDKNDAKLVRLELTPIKQLLKKGETAQITAFAHFNDGSKRDVTWLTKFDSNDAGAVTVSPAGKVVALRNGETAIRAAFQTEVAVALFTTPYEQNIDATRFQTRNNYIDDAVFTKLSELKLEPSDLCSDEEFVRRVYLDTIGTLPTAAEARSFLDDKRADKRSKLIDALLERPEWVDYWTLFLSDLMQNRKERDHDVRGTKGVRAFHTWLRQQVAKNRPWNEIVRDVLTATGSTVETPAIGYYITTIGEHREAEKSEVVASVAQAFMGTRVGCAQCHNHPLEKFTQDDYYHFAGYFSRVRLERKDPKEGATVLKVSHPDPNQNKSPVGVRQPRTGQFLPPQPLDRSVSPISPSDDPRIKLVNWMTDPKNESFSGAMVNRIWKHYLGVGMVEPVDDIRATNPPSNPELWAALNREFVGGGYNLKSLMRVILNSRTYQLSASTRPGNASDQKFYSHWYARRLPAEVLLDALSQTTGVSDPFEGYPTGVRAIQLPDSGVKSYFLSLFGRSDRVTACACERNGDVTMPQLLHLQCGENVQNKIRSGDGRLAGWLKTISDDSKLLDELFLSTLSRFPTATERQTILGERSKDDDREEFFRDVFWALLNSKAFSFNH